MSLLFRSLICQQTPRNVFQHQLVPHNSGRSQRLFYSLSRQKTSNLKSFITSRSTPRNVLPLLEAIKTTCLRRGSSFSLNKNIIGKSKFKNKFERHKRLKTDVIVYSHENDKFYLLFGYFGVFQMGIWIYMAFAAQQFKNVPSELTDSTDVPWYKWLILKQGQFKNSYSVLSIAVGLIVLFMSMTYPQRAVKRLWLLKDGKHVRIMTYSLFGRNRTIEAPLTNLNCTGSRTGPGGHIPIKVKDKTFFYTLDKKGLFHDNELFDFVVGLKRK